MDSKVEGDSKEESHQEEFLKTAGVDPADRNEAPRALADNRPIEPKSDGVAITMLGFNDARLKYDQDFSKIVQEDPPTPLMSGQTMPREFLVEFSGRRAGQAGPEFWYPRSATPDGPQVRLIFVPEGRAPSEVFYCDGKWDATEDGKAMVVFPDLEIGRGLVSFFMNKDRYHLPNEVNVRHRKTPDFQTEELLPLGASQGSLAFPVENEEVLPLGTFREGQRIIPLGSFQTGMTYRIRHFDKRSIYPVFRIRED